MIKTIHKHKKYKRIIVIFKQFNSNNNNLIINNNNLLINTKIKAINR